MCPGGVRTGVRAPMKLCHWLQVDFWRSNSTVGLEDSSFIVPVRPALEGDLGEMFLGAPDLPPRLTYMY